VETIVLKQNINTTDKYCFLRVSYVSVSVIYCTVKIVFRWRSWLLLLF